MEREEAKALLKLLGAGERIPFLEGIAIALGGDSLRYPVGEGLHEIADAIRELNETLKQTNRKEN